MASSSSSKTPRIAIKFGSGGTSKSNNNKSHKPSQTKPPSLLGKRSRKNGLGGSDSEDSNDETNNRHEEITGFDGDGTVTKRDDELLKNKNAPLVIKPPPTRNWSDGIKAKIAQNKQTDSQSGDGNKKIKWGLNYMEKRQPDEASTETKAPTPKPSDSAPPKSVEDQALDRLLGKTDDSGPKRTINHNEADAFKRDLQAAADVPALEEYDEMPVEEFGAAFLRGLGWDGKDNGVKPKTVTRRANQLGLGAKELKGAEELGGWDNGNKKRPRLAEYNEKIARDEKSRGGNTYRDDRERDKGRSNHHHHHNRERQMDIERQRERDRQFQEREKERKRDRDRGYDHDRTRDDRDRSREHDRDRDRGRSHKDRDRDYDRNCDRDHDRDHRSSRR